MNERMNQEPVPVVMDDEGNIFVDDPNNPGYMTEEGFEPLLEGGGEHLLPGEEFDHYEEPPERPRPETRKELGGSKNPDRGEGRISRDRR